MFEKKVVLLITGDILVLAGVTLVGFASHGTAETAGSRMLSTFIPLVFAWLLVAPHLGVFELERTLDGRQLWRPFWAMVLAGPLAAWMRGIWLGTAIQPIFVIVLGGISALSLLIWRVVFFVLMRRKK